MKRLIVPCAWCNKLYEIHLCYYKRKQVHCCSHTCSTTLRNTGKFGDKHPAFKNAFQVDKDGYIRKHCSLRKRLVAEHRLVMEKHLGRLLKTTEVVHHKNHNKQDNRVCNLVVLNHAEHSRQHRIGAI